MKKENISNALNNIDFDMVEDVYESTKVKKKKPKSLWLKWGAIAACLTIMIVAAGTVLPMMIDDPNTPPISTTAPKDEAGGVNGKVNVLEELTIIGDEYKFTDNEAVEYLSNAKEAIANDLKVSGINVSRLEIKEKGYSHIRTGDDGNSIAVNWRDYLAYDGDKLVAIIQVTKEETGIKHFILFGAQWFSHYNELMQQNSGVELVYIYIGDVEAFITPNNEVIPLMDVDISSTLEPNKDYYKFFKTQYNVYIP